VYGVWPRPFEAQLFPIVAKVVPVVGSFAWLASLIVHPSTQVATRGQGRQMGANAQCRGKAQPAAIQMCGIPSEPASLASDISEHRSIKKVCTRPLK